MSQSKRPPLYALWRAMLARCENPNATGFARYGGRGVVVCDRWHVFANFVADMGPRPDGCSLDRIDNDGNYEPGNCRWATWKQQNNNRRTRRGDDHPKSKTCSLDVRRMRDLHSLGLGITAQGIADLFCVGRSSVYAILQRRNWRHT